MLLHNEIDSKIQLNLISIDGDEWLRLYPFVRFYLEDRVHELWSRYKIQDGDGNND